MPFYYTSTCKDSFLITNVIYVLSPPVAAFVVGFAREGADMQWLFVLTNRPAEIFEEMSHTFSKSHLGV
jgi:hypothetical protein